MKKINLLKPSCSDLEIKYVNEVLLSGWWGLGPKTELFEKQFADFTNSKYAIAVNSATAALHISLRILKDFYKIEKPNIIVPSLTFVSTALVGLYEGVEVRFADVDERTYCIDPYDVIKKIDKNTLAIIPVHYAGNSACVQYKWQDRHIPVIEDCAHAVGNLLVGFTGEMSCWSFHPVKNLATGDMGAITTNNYDFMKSAQRIRWCGINADTWKRENGGYNWEYDIKEIGYKYHANDIMAAIALAQLERIENLNKHRKQIADRYSKELVDLPITLPPLSGSWHLYVIRMEAEKRNHFIDYMRANNIAVGVHYKPVHLYPIFDQKWVGQLPVTEKLFKEFVSLPIYPDLTEDEQTIIIKKIRHYFSL